MIQVPESPQSEARATAAEMGYKLNIKGASSVKLDVCRLQNTLDFVWGVQQDRTASWMGTAFHILAAYAMTSIMKGHEPSLDELLDMLDKILDEFETIGVWSPHSNSFDNFHWDPKYALDCSEKTPVGREARVYTPREAWQERLGKAVELFYDNHMLRFEPVAVEQHLTIMADTGEDALITTPDLVGIDKATGRLTVVDWKTSQRKGTTYFKQRVLPQLTLYSWAYATKNKLDEYPDTLVVQYVLPRTKTIPKVEYSEGDPMRINPQQADLAVRRLQQAFRTSMEQRQPDWVPMPVNGWMCERCNHQAACANFTTFEQVVAEEKSKAKIQ